MGGHDERRYHTSALGREAGVGKLWAGSRNLGSRPHLLFKRARFSRRRYAESIGGAPHLQALRGAAHREEAQERRALGRFEERQARGGDAAAGGCAYLRVA